MNCVFFLTTLYGIVLIISTILVISLIIILGENKDGADCHAQKTFLAMKG